MENIPSIDNVGVKKVLYMIDPEWFYSAISQSGAAIVWLLSGILGSYILRHISDMKNEREDILYKVNEINSLRKTLDSKLAAEKNIISKNINHYRADNMNSILVESIKDLEIIQDIDETDEKTVVSKLDHEIKSIDKLSEIITNRRKK